MAVAAAMRSVSSGHALWSSPERRTLAWSQAACTAPTLTRAPLIVMTAERSHASGPGGCRLRDQTRKRFRAQPDSFFLKLAAMCCHIGDGQGACSK